MEKWNAQDAKKQAKPPKKRTLDKIFVDDVDDLIFTGSTTMFTHSASIRVNNNYETKCAVYECDNLTKYKIAMNTKDSVLYVFSSQYGWQICDQHCLRQLPLTKVSLARKHPGKEIIINKEIGHRDCQFNEISIFDSMETESVPERYCQHQLVVENSCVWLAACLVLRSVDNDVAEIMLQYYVDDPPKFEWLFFIGKRLITPNHYMIW